jgi:hypothetical protein
MHSQLEAPVPEPDDPRFEWINVPEYGNEDQWIRGRCKHLTPIPVEAYPTGELVARLCPDCNAQLPVSEPPVDWIATFTGFL